MEMPEQGPFRALALLLLVGGLVAGAVVPGLMPSLTDPAQGQGPGEAPTETSSYDSPKTALDLRSLSSTPQDTLAHLSANRDAPDPPPVPQPEGDDPLPDAIRTLAKAPGTPETSLDDPATQRALDRAARLPQPIQEDLASLVLAVADARHLQAEAVEDLDPDQRVALASGDLSAQQAEAIRSQVDVDKSLQAARLVDEALRQARPALEAWSDASETLGGRTQGVPGPAEPPTPAQQAPSIVDALGTPETPEEMLRSSAKLDGVDATLPPMPPALEEASLQELVVATYGLLDLPRGAAPAASVAAVPGLDADVRETSSTALRYYLMGLLLQRAALADLSPAQQAALQAAANDPSVVGSPTLAASDLAPQEAALLSSAVDAVDREKVHQSAMAFAKAGQVLGAAAVDTPDAPVDADCPRNTRDPSVQGVSPVRTDRPVTCSVGDLTVRLGLTGDTAVHLSVDTDGDGEPDAPPLALGRGSGIRLHWNPDMAQVTVYEDEDDDGQADPEEVEFRTEPLRDRSNNVAFVDPFGFFVVGGEGPTTFDGRYGRVNVPPAPRDDRVDSLRQRALDADQDLPFPVLADDGSGIAISSSNSGAFCPGDSCAPDSRRLDDTVWRTAHKPPNATVNPNGTHLLTVDLDGDSTYTRNVGATSVRLVASWDPDRSVTVAGVDTGVSGDGPDFTEFIRLAPAASLDLGGNDTYVPDVEGGITDRNFTIGAGFLGAPGVAIDRGGDDVYHAENASVGLGTASGLGLVAALGGDDEFVAHNLSLGAGSSEGTGLLLTGGGNDTYRSGYWTQGMGFNGRSKGLMVDAGAGDDLYRTRFTPGPFSFEGSNIVFEKVAQGASINSATGFLLDGGGDDTYQKEDRPDNVDRPHVQGISYGSTCPAFRVCAFGEVGFPSVLADLGGDDEGLRITGNVSHSRLAEVGVGPHFTDEGLTNEDAQEGQRRAPTGYVLDVETRDDPQVTGDGYLLAPGEVTWDTGKDPVARSAFTLTVPGLLAVGDTSTTNWTESYVVSLDLGGDDVYENRPGSATVLPRQLPSVSTGVGTGGGPLVGSREARPRLVSLHADLGGSDTYEAEDGIATPSSRALGSGIGAVGLAYDLAETGSDDADEYKAGTRALGHGEAGVGVFYDEAGDDTYRFTNASSPSRGLGFASLGGVAVFADATGDDTYHAGNLSAGAYDLQLTSEEGIVDDQAGGGGNADAADAETGSAAFFDGAGADTYNVSEQALGRVVEEPDPGGTSTGNDQPFVGDARPAAALFIDDGFGIDAYPEAHTDAGRGNNDFWNNTALGRGFDNLDYYMNYQIVWAGDDTAQRAASLLLSPSARILEPDFAQDETLRGSTPVTVNASYGGNRSLVLNARSLAVAPLRTDVNATDVPVVAGLQRTVDDTAEDVIEEVPNPTPDSAPTAGELGHYGVDYAEATYYALQFMLKSEEERDGRTAPPRYYQDETQRGADLLLAPAGVRAQLPGGEGAINGSTSRNLQSEALGIPYGYLDGIIIEAGATDFTSTVVGFLGQDVSSSAPVGSPNSVANTTFDQGHGAVDFATGATPAASPSLTWAASQHLLVVKALAAGLPGGQAVDTPVDDALASIHDETPAPAAEPAPEADQEEPAEPGPTECPTVFDGVDAETHLACSIRAAFHTTVDAADDARGSVDEMCRAANGTDPACDEADGAADALPEVINPPRGGAYVRVVELSADGKPVASVEGTGDTTYELLWNTSERDDDGRYRWEDGNHTLTAQVYYRPADPRPNRGVDADPQAGQTRTSDPYGFYPGTDRIVVETDNPPLLYEAQATDFNPEPGDEADRCGDTLNCKLNFTAAVSEDLDTVDVEVRGPDGSTVEAFEGLGTHRGDPFNLSLDWEATAADVPDGRYRLNVTLDEPGHDAAPTAEVPFFVTRDAPRTLATPAANDDGYSGVQHVDVATDDDGEVDQSVETPVTLNVTTLLQADEPRSPVDSFDLYRRVYNPSANKQESELADEFPDCPGTVDDKTTTAGDQDKWCLVAEDVPGNRTAMNLTRILSDGEKAPIEDRRLYLVARATDRAGNEETRPFPDVGADIGDGEGPEGETYVDLTEPISFPLIEPTPRQETTVHVPFQTEEGPIRDVTVLWDLAPNSTAAGADTEPLPDDLVDTAEGTFTWTADHPGVDADPGNGDVLYLLLQATDLAGNVEQQTTPSIPPIPFDLAGPAVEGNVTVDPAAGSLAVNWTSTEVLDQASVAYWPQDDPSEVRVVNATGTARVHGATLGNLTQNTDYVVELRMEDQAGNSATVVEGPYRTDPIVQVDPLAPADGDVVTGDVTVAWTPRNVTGDPVVQYNVTLAPDGGACTVPLGETEFFEGQPARREFTFDSTEVPDVLGAQICLRANNTLNPEDPVVTRFPANGSFAIDNAAPTTNVTVTGPGTGEWVQGRATVVLEATDDTDGPVTTRYRLDGGPLQTYDGPITLTEDGVHTLEYRSEDALGHVEPTREETIRVDATPPNGSLVVEDGAGRTDSTEVTLTINGTDAVSGVSDVIIRSPQGQHHRRLPGALLQGGSVDVPWTVTAGDGRKEIVTAVVDEAGNQLTLRRTVTLDTKPPAFEALGTAGVAFTQAGVEWATDEPATGTVLYKEKGSPAFQGRVDVNETGVQGTAVLRNLTPSTTYVAQVSIADDLGNENTRTLSFTTETDATPPGPVEDLRAAADDDGFVEVNWTASFDEVGVASYVVARSTGDDAYVRVAETPRTVLLDDEAPAGETVDYKVQAIDVGGNAGPPSEPVTVETETAPEVLEAGVTPDEGTPDTEFTYRVVVRDRDGDTPEHVRVLVDGQPRPMSPAGSGSIEDGVAYTLETDLDVTTLSQGTHDYAFQVSDGTHEVTWPEDDRRVGPVVVTDDGDDGGVAGLGAARQAVPGPSLALAVAGIAGAALLAPRRWTP